MAQHLRRRTFRCRTVVAIDLDQDAAAADPNDRNKNPSTSAWRERGQ